MTDTQRNAGETDRTREVGAQHVPSAQHSHGSVHELPENVKVALTPLRVVLGILAIVIGIGSGLIMSSATFFK